MIMNIVA